ncbi:hypothetical protein OG216_39115 [Streptomycetaceae bacterium NBC_01309]
MGVTFAGQGREDRLTLVRGGPAAEFTVTVVNGDTRAYAHIRTVISMESLPGAPNGGPQQGFVLEAFDAVSGTWRQAPIRIAQDVLPPSLVVAGTPLALDETRIERYRIRATATGPVGSTPLVVDLVNTDAPDSAMLTSEARPAHVAIPHTTRKA